MPPSHQSHLRPDAGFHPKLTTRIVDLVPIGFRTPQTASSSPSSADATQTTLEGQQQQSRQSSSAASCSLQVLYSLSSSIILDQYQLRQLHGEGRLITARRVSSSSSSSNSSRDKGKGRSISADLFLGGYLDLEAPVNAVNKDSRAIALFSIPMAPPAAASNPSTSMTINASSVPMIPSMNVNIELPLHVRYQEPVLSRWVTRAGRDGFGGPWWSKLPLPSSQWQPGLSAEGQQKRQDVVEVQVEWPCVFWACNSEPEEALQDASPYRRMSLSDSCLALVPQELRQSLPTTSPLHPDTLYPYHYLLPIASETTSGCTMADTPTSLHTPSSVVRVPTGVLGDLKLVHFVNLAATWLAVLLIIRRIWQSSRTWSAERRLLEARRKVAEAKSQ